MLVLSMYSQYLLFGCYVIQFSGLLTLRTNKYQCYCVFRHNQFQVKIKNEIKTVQQRLIISYTFLFNFHYPITHFKCIYRHTYNGGGGGMRSTPYYFFNNFNWNLLVLHIILRFILNNTIRHLYRCRFYSDFVNTRITFTADTLENRLFAARV